MKTISTIRRENLDALISKAGSLTALAFSAKSSSVYLSQIKHQELDKKTGKPRQMGDNIARRLETASEKPVGWMDQDHGTDHAQIPRENLAVLVQNQPVALVEKAPLATNTLAEFKRICEGLAGYLMMMDDDAREDAAAALHKLALKPERHLRAAEKLNTAFAQTIRKAA